MEKQSDALAIPLLHFLLEFVLLDQPLHDWKAEESRILEGVSCNESTHSLKIRNRQPRDSKLGGGPVFSSTLHFLAQHKQKTTEHVPDDVQVWTQKVSK